MGATANHPMADRSVREYTRGESRPTGAGCRPFNDQAIITTMSGEKCLMLYQECADLCGYCASACLREERSGELIRCIALSRACADVCTLTAGEVLRGSAFAGEWCAFCATVCDSCAEECSRYEMRHCQKCAAICRECAASCRLEADALALAS